MKIKVFVKDGTRLEQYKAKYDPDNQICEIRKKIGFLSSEPERFEVNSDHIVELVKKGKIREGNINVEYWVIVDRKSRKSIPIGESNNPNSFVDQKIRNQLDYLIDRSFWKALVGKVKISIFTALILMFAGYGLIRFIEHFFNLIMTR